MTQRSLKKIHTSGSSKTFEDPNSLPSVPNLLTLSRIALIPIIVAAFYTENSLGRWIATLAFICGCLTDFLDGYVARLWSQTSKFGQFLDPVADKLLVASTLLMLVGFGRIQPLSFFPAIVILCREILVSGLREYLSNNQIPMPVTALAKWKTMAQMMAISLLLIGNTTPLGDFVCNVGEVLLWLAALLTLITGYSYLKSQWQHL
ncbi:MAG: CDP-diacylglycerol--glycerol-3-phosphate 3-phosphatidyltransferase [Alphaproteobacteria bacterium]|nr:CDP-diacylglycerol--glycerol-3-phosphate 3-phosphatidyltransferase [Alphaproteobacteria bacterium]